MTPIRTAALAALMIGSGVVALAQDHPNLERGFFADQAYQLSNIDSVNLYNGNLTLTIPIGQTYHVGGNLSYGLTLYYNSTVWDFQQRQFYPPNPGGGCALPPQSDPVWLTVANPVKGVNAGLGWTLSLGALDGPYGQSDSPSWIYTSPDGGKHAFFSTLHDFAETAQHRTTAPCSPSAPCNVYYTRDNTYLRLVAIVDSCGKVLGGDVEFPDGTVQHFDTGNAACCTTGCVVGAPLTKISDRFGNTLNVTYPSGNWQLSDGTRTTTVYVTSGLLGPQIDHINVATFGSTTATYQFYYTTKTIARSCKQDDMTGYCRPASTTVSVPLLVAISLPDTTAYCMNSDCTAYNPTTSTLWYNTQSACDLGGGNILSPKDLPGTLTQVQLPTHGTIAWTYSAWAQDPAGGLCSCTPTSTCSPSGWPLDVQQSAGVSQRTLSDPVGSNVSGTWTYAHESPSVRNAAGFPNEARTTVTSPNLDDTVYYFRAQACYGVYSPYTGQGYGWDYSLPYTTNQSDGETSPDTKYLSTQFYRGTGGSRTLLRSVYVRYDSDVNYIGQYQILQAPSSPEYWYLTNRRLAGQRTVYNEDSGTYADTTSSGFDFVGHFRLATTAGTFASGNARTSTVDFNPTLTTWQVNWPGNSAWVLGTFDYHQQSEAGIYAKQTFCFDANTGALQRARTLTSGTAEGPHDLVGVFSYDASGNPASEQYYGGDTQTVATTTPLCSVSLPATNQYRIDHTWQYGSMKSSRYYDSSGTAMSFYSLDMDIDANTGLPATSRDGAGIATTYLYDNMSRLTWEKPAAGQGAYVEHQYAPWSGTDAAYVDECTKPNGTTTACASAADTLSRSSLRFDGLGRPYLAARKLPDGTWNQQKTYRNGSGWTTAVSEWYPNGTADASMSKTQYTNFDAFGRPGTITLPDSKTVTLAYTGVRQIQRTVSIATSTTSETTATTTEVYDRQGRLYQLTEPSGSGGANVMTTYGYDVGSRLHSTSTTSGSTTQTRTFTYDNRGFLTAEQLPEKGATGNGTVTYSNFDPLGHVGRVVDGPNDLTATYDRAERLTNVRITSGNSLIDLAYATANGLGDYANGKLRTATRHNWISGVDNQVVETYTYGGTGGAASQRATTAEGQSVSQGFAWTDIGLPSSVTYPQIAGIGPARTVSDTYTYGFLTSVPSYATGITYSVNAMLYQITHANAVVATYGPDGNNIQRIGGVTTAGASSNNLALTPFAYDGAGDIKAIGGQTFVYDKVSRLVTANILANGASKQQTAAFDAFGNITSTTTTDWGTQTFSLNAATNRLNSPVTYDAAGDITSWGGFSYTWDALGKMQTVSGTGINHTYLYTADGERISDRDSLGGTTTLTVRGLDGKVLRIYVKSGSTWSWSKDYVYQQGMLLASVDASTTRHFDLDHLGMPRLITGSGGTTLAIHDYYPFGMEAYGTADGERMKFTGHELDGMGTAGQGDDLDNMHARLRSG
jgi:hypothetical protein